MKNNTPEFYKRPDVKSLTGNGHGQENPKTPLMGTGHALKNLESLTKRELREAVTGLGEKKFRADQIYDWTHRKAVSSYEEMRNVPGHLREQMARLYPMAAPKILARQISGIDGTRKYLFGFADSSSIESVWMSYHHGNTVCVSSQVGCRMGCSFCASTIGGLERNLTSGEMLSQIYAITRDTGERVSNVVVMGTGEPLDNYDNLIRFLHMLSDEDGLHISERSITVSTCGLAPNIRRLAGEHLMVGLALSLHAPNDGLRRKIMPVAKSFSLKKDILPAMRMYYESNRRRLTFEYALIRGVNDTDACAAELAVLLRGINCLVNLIPVNPVRETAYTGTAPADTRAFKKKLENHGIHATIRREMGRDIDGACGQLRYRCVSGDRGS